MLASHVWDNSIKFLRQAQLLIVITQMSGLYPAGIKADSIQMAGAVHCGNSTSGKVTAGHCILL